MLQDFFEEDIIINVEPLNIEYKFITPRIWVDNSEHYTYIYLDPRKPGNYIYEVDDGEIFRFAWEPIYVGKGRDYKGNYEFLNRLKKAYKIKDKKNTPLDNKIRSIKRKVKQDPVIYKIKKGILEKKSRELEIKLIAAIGRKDKGLGPLLNLTNGGEGLCGYVCTQEHKKKISRKLKGRKHTKKHNKKVSEAKKGHFVSNETRKKQSEIAIQNKRSVGVKNPNYGKFGKKHHNYGKCRSNEVKEKIRKGNKGKKRTFEQKKRIGESHKGLIPWNKGLKDVISVETREKMRESQRKLWTIEKREKQSKRNKKYYKTTEGIKTRKKMSNKKKEFYVTEEGKAIMKEAIKKRIYKKKCVICDKVFESKSSYAKYCRKCKQNIKY